MIFCRASFCFGYSPSIGQYLYSFLKNSNGPVLICINFPKFLEELVGSTAVYWLGELCHITTRWSFLKLVQFFFVTFEHHVHIIPRLKADSITSFSNISFGGWVLNSQCGFWISIIQFFILIFQSLNPFQFWVLSLQCGFWSLIFRCASISCFQVVSK